MNRAVAVSWTDELVQRPWGRPRVDDQVRTLQLSRENARLAEENHRLRAQNADLEASAEIWIKLYEAALARANRTPNVELANW